MYTEKHNSKSKIIRDLIGEGDTNTALLHTLSILDALNFRIEKAASTIDDVVDFNRLIGREAYMHYVTEGGDVPHYEVIYRFTDTTELMLGEVANLQKDYLEFLHEMFGDKDFSVTLIHFKDEGYHVLFEASVTFESKWQCMKYVRQLWESNSATESTEDEIIDVLLVPNVDFMSLIGKAEKRYDLDALKSIRDAFGYLMEMADDATKSYLTKLFYAAGEARSKVLELKANASAANYFDSEEFLDGIERLTEYISQRQATWAHVYYFLIRHGLSKMTKSKFGNFIRGHGGPSAKTVYSSGNYSLSGNELVKERRSIDLMKTFFPNIE